MRIPIFFYPAPSCWKSVTPPAPLACLEYKLWKVPSLYFASFLKHYFPSFWTVHSCWHRGHRLFCLIHRLMQHWWKEWLHSPHTTTQSLPPRASTLDSDWHLRQASITWTLQMAHVSHSTSQLHMATAFHFFSVNILGPASLAWSAPLDSPFSTTFISTGASPFSIWPRQQLFQSRR